MTDRIEDGDSLEREYGDVATLELINELTLNEMVLRVYYERCGNDLEVDPELYTFEVFEIDRVILAVHQRTAEEIIADIFDTIKGIHP